MVNKVTLSLMVALMLLLTSFYVNASLAETEATETADPGSPTIVSFSPGVGATIDTTNKGVAISISLKDDVDKIDATSIALKVDGTTVNAQFQYAGYYEYDSCGSPYLVENNYKEGSLTYQTALKDGEHFVEFTVADINGNVLHKQWSFTTASKPKFSFFTPANATVINSVYNAPVAVKVVDDDGIAIDSINFKVNNEQVDVAFDSATGILSYTGPLVEGGNTVDVSVADSLGHVATTGWAFTVSTTQGPQITSIEPAEGATIDTSSNSTKVSITVKDAADQINASSVVLKLDGTVVNAQFQYTGYYEYDSCGEPYYIITNNKEGTVTYQASLKDGQHQAELSVADSKGNMLTKQWSFTTGSKPKFSAFSPAATTVLNSAINVPISVKVTDDTGIAADSIILTINNITVKAAFDSATGIISYVGIMADGINVVKVSVADSLGNVGTTNWSFTVSSTSGPKITSVQPAEDSVTSTRKIFANLKSTHYKIGAITLKVDGTSVTPNFTYTGHWESDSCTGDYYVIDNYLEGTLENNLPNLKDGPHTVSLTVADEKGNTVSKNWSFTLKTLPKLSNTMPSIAYLTERRPQISAKVTDFESDGQIKMLVDGVAVTTRFDSSTGLISYTPSQDLANEAMHKVDITVSDFGGTTSYVWKFYINTYPDMIDSNYTSCTACHPVSGPKAIESAVHNGLAFGGNHTQASDDCYDCHSYITIGAGCVQCHEDPDDPSDDGLYGHGDTPSIKYGPQSYDASVPIRVTQNREIYDCIICHQPGTQTKAYEGFWAKPTRVMNNHDLPEIHLTAATNCNKCHARSLTREHAQAGRTDSAGNPITCNTCHLSSDPTVQTVIANYDKSCQGCHENADHHDSGTQTSNCILCHS